MAANLIVDEPSNKDEMEISSEELNLIKGGRPAFFAIKRMDPELASHNPRSPEENIYQFCQRVSSKLLELLDSLTPELVTYSYMGHWADREQCRGRLEILNRAKVKLRSVIIHIEDTFRVIREVISLLNGELPILVLDKVTKCMDNILDDDFKKFQALHKTSEIIRQVFTYLCECCFVPIPSDQLSDADMLPKMYCDCHTLPSSFCSTCGLPLAPCSLCANVKMILQIVRTLTECEFNLVGSYNNSDFHKVLGEKSIEEMLMFASDSEWECECPEVSDSDDDTAEDGGDEENA